MRVLLDECMPRKLRRELPDHEVRTVVEVGWAGMKNGRLLRQAAEEFDVLLTVDANIEHQQNTCALPIAVVLLVCYSNDVEVLKPMMLDVRKLLSERLPRGLYQVGPIGQAKSIDGKDPGEDPTWPP